MYANSEMLCLANLGEWDVGPDHLPRPSNPWNNDPSHDLPVRTLEMNLQESLSTADLVYLVRLSPSARSNVIF